MINKSICKVFIKELEASYNKNGITGIYYKLNQIENNPLINSETYDYIKAKFYKKYGTLINVRKVLYIWKSLCIDRLDPKNSCLLDLSNHTELMPSKKIVVSSHNSLSKWVFSIKELNRVIHSNLIFSMDGFPEPQSPKNPYTNVNFTIGQLAYIYNVLVKSGIKVPMIIHKFKSCGFSIKYFKRTYYRELTEHASYHYINNLDEEEFLKYFDTFVHTYKEFICHYCIKNITKKRDIFSKVISLFIIFMNEPIENIKKGDFYITQLTKRITDMIGIIVLQNPHFSNSKQHKLDYYYKHK
tara:strand:- start:314 stop:1210 length:897 start_codon:yes stop_codon:yes gene_type:complete